MENKSIISRIISTLKKIVIWAVVIGIAALVFLYNVSYEEGVMAGKVLRISQKGMLFKTYEGKINLETFGALKGVSPIAESFDFSVKKSETDLVKELEEAALDGDRVNLYFVKYYVAFPWRGDTKYFASKIERLEK
ncbi:MAG TPA: hypothetical protein PLJ60_11120 [Chryseolinea sp.]|nr:hypothetical protein [Chryseolinea sp.]HPM30873.1 hypothetical protein [Chryseolinea sp.]